MVPQPISEVAWPYEDKHNSKSTNSPKSKATSKRHITSVISNTLWARYTDFHFPSDAYLASRSGTAAPSPHALRDSKQPQPKTSSVVWKAQGRAKWGGVCGKAMWWAGWGAWPGGVEWGEAGRGGMGWGWISFNSTLLSRAALAQPHCHLMLLTISSNINEHWVP